MLITDAEWDLVESPFSSCARDRAHHVALHLVVLQRPCVLLSVEAVKFELSSRPARMLHITCLLYLLAVQSTSLMASRVSTHPVVEVNLVTFFNR